MTDIYILQDIHYQNLGGYDPDDSWSRNSTREDVTLKGWSLERPSGDWDSVTVEFTPDLHETLYALCVSYDTGDSFGRDEGKLEVVHLFRDRNIAQENLNALGDSYYQSKGGIFDMKLDDGSVKEIYAPHMGYFESLNDVFLEPLTHKGGKISYRDLTN